MMSATRPHRKINRPDRFNDQNEAPKSEERGQKRRMTPEVSEVSAKRRRPLREINQKIEKQEHVDSLVFGLLLNARKEMSDSFAQECPSSDSQKLDDNNNLKIIIPKVVKEEVQESSISPDKTIEDDHDYCTKSRHSNTIDVKLFEEKVEVTSEGYPYATVRQEYVYDLLKKDVILDLLQNSKMHEKIQHLFIPRPPFAPPLTESKAAFAFFIDGRTCLNIKELSRDGLSPWHSPVERPKSKRWRICNTNGNLVLQSALKKDSSDCCLVEYSARLPRELRLRKKLYYIVKNNEIQGNCIIIYNYESPGKIPTINTDCPSDSTLSSSANTSSGSSPIYEQEEESVIQQDVATVKHVEKEVTTIQPTVPRRKLTDIELLDLAYAPTYHNEHYERMNIPEHLDHPGLYMNVKVYGGIELPIYF